MFASALSFVPRFSFKLTEAELEALNKMSRQHYDRVCKSASESGGFIYGFRNVCYNFNPFDPERVYEAKELGPLTFREVDTLAKICEGASFLHTDAEKLLGSDLGFFFSSVLRAMNNHVPDEVPARTFLPKYAEPLPGPVAAPEPGPPLSAISAVHASHCCKCGCKYGDGNCPVVAGHVTGTDCEDCTTAATTSAN